MLVTLRDRLNAHDAATHRPRSPWGVSVFQAQWALIGITELHGAAADTDVRLRGAQLNALTGASMPTRRNDLYEYARLGALTITASDSPWAGAQVASPE